MRSHYLPKALPVTRATTNNGHTVFPIPVQNANRTAGGISIMIDLVKEELDEQGVPTGVEEDNKTSIDEERIAEPFDPENIDVSTRSMTVDLLLSRARSGMIDLQPDFQRRWGIWDRMRQSRLIESLLLKIPLPVLYAAENENEGWEIVDGIQRLSTISRFIEPAIINEPGLVLSSLEYLHAYNDKVFDDLSDKLKMRLKETELVVHLIKRGTPVEVKFNIFARINTGGVRLSSQELRHAIVPGIARGLLEQWSTTPEFLAATTYSVRSIRMDDRELVLRFIAFKSFGVEQYKQADMDSFLVSAMRAINNMPPPVIAEMLRSFKKSMRAAQNIFGDDAFRKRYDVNNSRLPINKALFEAVSVSLANLEDDEIRNLQENSQVVRDRFIDLCSHRGFDSAISQGTGDIGKVNRRFEMMSSMLKGAVSYDK